jgi:hypothetical protein
MSMFWKKKQPDFEWPNSKQLDAAMKEGQRLQQPHFKPFFVALVNAELAVPLHHALVTDGDKAADRKLALLTMQRNGEVVPVAFTSETAFRLHYGQQTLHIARASAPEVCDIVLRNSWKSLVLNPNGPVGYELRLPELQAVAHRHVYEGDHRLRVQEQTSVQLGQLTDRPDDETMQAIKSILEGADVSEAWWCGIAYNKGEPNYCLGIAAHDIENASSFIGPRIQKLWEQREQKRLIDIMNLNDGLGDTIRNVGECIWQSEPPR